MAIIHTGASVVTLIAGICCLAFFMLAAIVLMPFTKAYRKRRARDELLRVAATVQVNPDDVVGYIKERHASEGDKLSRDQLHMLYNAIAAELAVNRAKALISEVDKSP